ncbi:MAG: hypothetical protein GY772_24125, partial [bacterium]|nr:hypothetical protein [bacterium]
MHQTLLEYGQCEAVFAAAFQDVRQCLSDMGAEFGIGSSADVRAASLGGDPAACRAEDAKGYLFPFALEVPGSQHSTDVCLRLALGALPFWARWQAQAKVACQFLASANQRDKLRELLRAGQCGQCDEAAAEASLVNSCERFAAWRWGTLRRAAESLLRMEAAVRAVCGPMRDYRQLGVGEGSGGALVLELARTDAFWWETRAVLYLTTQFADFAGWLRGCACHELLLRVQPGSVACEWKGCRARELSAKVGAVAEALERDRRSLVAGRFGPVDVSLPARAISRAL